MKNLLLLGLLYLVGCSSLIAQGERQLVIDSLKDVVEHASHDTIKVNALNLLVDEYISIDPRLMQESTAKAKEIIELNLKKDLSEIERRAFKVRLSLVNLNTGRYNYFIGRYDSALYYFQKSYEIEEEMGRLDRMIVNLSNIGVMHEMLGEIDQAIKIYNEVVELSIESGNKQTEASGYLNLGVVYQFQGNYVRAVEVFLKCLELDKESGDPLSLSNSYANLAMVYRAQGKFEMALKYLDKSMEYAEEAEDVRSKATILGEYGAIYLSQDKIKEAEYYFKALKSLSEKTEDMKSALNAYSNLAEVFVFKNEFDSAFYYANKSLQIGNENNDIMAQTNGNMLLAQVFMHRKEYLKAIQYGTTAMKLAESAQTIRYQQNITEVLYLSYKNRGNNTMALQMLEKHIEIKDSLNKIENEKALVKQEFQFSYDLQLDSLNKVEEIRVIENRKKEALAQKDSERKNLIIIFGAIGLVFILFFTGFAINRLRLSKKQNKIIEEQKDIVEEKNAEIIDSISYAKRIQSAILPPEKLMNESLQNFFILYQPKDIVSGDFYWFEKKEESVYLAAADCTGHGVPGAMVSVICNSGLNRSVREFGLRKPGEILNKTREIVIQEFEKSEEEVKDGMDIALVSLVQNEKQKENEDPDSARSFSLSYAGAHNPLWIIRKGGKEIEEIKANKQPIGKFTNPEPYTTHEVELNSGDTIYIFSDGYADQFGGEKGKKYKTGNFKKLLLSIQEESMEEQRASLHKNFENWRGDIEQIDDVCVIGIRV